jgi:ribulose-5-phosphate 4-epimerase/fuculose-1-phosphate aldolase
MENRFLPSNKRSPFPLVAGEYLFKGKEEGQFALMRSILVKTVEVQKGEPVMDTSAYVNQPISQLSNRQQLAIMLRILGRAGYQETITGHLTFRDGDDETVLVNPVDVLWEDMRASDLLRVAPDNSIVEGTHFFNPTAGFHFAVHERRKDIRVVLHNHPPFGNIWASACKVPPLLDQSGTTAGGKVVLVSEYEGTLEDKDRARHLAESFADADMAILAHHGVLVVGATLDIVLARALTFEWRARRAYEVAAMGISNPEELPPLVAAQVATLGPIYGQVLLEVYGKKMITLDASVLE